MSLSDVSYQCIYIYIYIYIYITSLHYVILSGRRAGAQARGLRLPAVHPVSVNYKLRYSYVMFDITSYHIL